MTERLQITKESLEPSPDRLMSLRFGYIAARAVGAGVEVGLFDALSGRDQTIDQLAQSLGCSRRGLRALCPSLVTLGFLSRNLETYALSAEARTYLVASSPHYLGGMIVATDRHWNKWQRLPEAVTTGTPPHDGIESDADEGRFFGDFVQGLYNMNLPAARETARQLARPGLRIADLGCGSGVWSIPWAQLGNCKVVGVDRASILENVTPRYLREGSVEGAYELRPGNIRSVELEDASYDVVMLGHVLHSEGLERSKTLLARCRKALRPGGRVIVAEMIPDDERSQDLYGVLFGLNMLLLTEEGEVFTAPELEQLLDEAGFSQRSWIEVPFRYPILVGEI